MNSEEYKHKLARQEVLDYTQGIVSTINKVINPKRLENTIFPMIDSLLAKLKDIDNADLDPPDHDNAETHGRPF